MRRRLLYQKRERIYQDYRELDSLLMHMSKEAEKFKHLEKRGKEKKKAKRETINKEELLKQGQLSNDSSFTIDEDVEPLDDDGLLTKKRKTADSVVSSHTDGTQRSYNAMPLVMDVLKDLNSGPNDKLDRQLNEGTAVIERIVPQI